MKYIDLLFDSSSKELDLPYEVCLALNEEIKSISLEDIPFDKFGELADYLSSFLAHNRVTADEDAKLTSRLALFQKPNSVGVL